MAQFTAPILAPHSGAFPLSLQPLSEALRNYREPVTI
jgi:hypothetical protein